jgi:hypothetical protein
LDPWQALKTPLRRISATGELRMWLSLNAVTIATVIRNVCLSRHRKADLESFRSGIQTLATLTHLVAQKRHRTLAVQSVHNMSRTEAGI